MTVDEFDCISSGFRGRSSLGQGGSVGDREGRSRHTGTELGWILRVSENMSKAMSRFLTCMMD